MNQAKNLNDYGSPQTEGNRTTREVSPITWIIFASVFTLIGVANNPQYLGETIPVYVTDIDRDGQTTMDIIHINGLVQNEKLITVTFEGDETVLSFANITDLLYWFERDLAERSYRVIEKIDQSK